MVGCLHGRFNKRFYNLLIVFVSVQQNRQGYSVTLPIYHFAPACYNIVTASHISKEVTTMKFTFTEKKMTSSDSLRDYSEKKISKLEKLFS